MIDRLTPDEIPTRELRGYRDALALIAESIRLGGPVWESERSDAIYPLSRLGTWDGACWTGTDDEGREWSVETA